MKETLREIWSNITLNAKGWQILLALTLITFIGVVTVFGITAIKDYYLESNNNQLTKQIEESVKRQIQLETILAETLGALKETKNQLGKETLKRIEADRILSEQNGVTDDDIKKYDETKKQITVDNNDYTTNELCERAKAFGIVCR